MKRITLISSIFSVGILVIAESASAVIYQWSFTNENGNVGNTSDTVSGFVEFSATSFGNLADQMMLNAIDLQITEVTIDGTPSTGTPFFGDGGVELNKNLVSNSDIFNFENLWSFDSSSNISQVNFVSIDSVPNETFELSLSSLSQLTTGNTPALSLNDSDSSSIIFDQQASTPVPFELDATLGILVVGGIVTGSSLLKRRQNVTK